MGKVKKVSVPSAKQVKEEIKENFKRKHVSDADSDIDSDSSGDAGGANEMASMFQKFSSDLKRKTSAKKKKLSGLAADSAKLTREKLDTILDQQGKVRQTLTKEYKKQIENVFAQWETDIARAKDAEDKLVETLNQQQKLLNQVRLVQTQRLKATKNLYDQYIASVEEAETSSRKQHEDFAADLKKEMAELQRKIFADTQAQEMANMRKVLRTVMQ